jgi:hypothetical protein
LPYSSFLVQCYSRPGIKLITRQHAEAVLHADFESGLYCIGDVELWSPERWPNFVDNWRFTPTPEAVLAEQQEAALAIITENDRTWEEIDSCEQEEDWAEFEAWLDGLAPTPGELEARDLGDCGFGHLELP